MERREEGLTRGHIPARGLILVAAADVQMNGIWVEVIAIAQNRESWVVEALWLGGETFARRRILRAAERTNPRSLVA
jgi:phage terminase large subunit GpA-like protein